MPSVMEDTSWCCMSDPKSLPAAVHAEHTSAYVSMRQHTYAKCNGGHELVLCERPEKLACSSTCQAYVSIRQHTSAYVSKLLLNESDPQERPERVSIRQHTSACVSIRQHTSAYVSIRQHTPAE